MLHQGISYILFALNFIAFDSNAEQFIIIVNMMLKGKLYIWVHLEKATSNELFSDFIQTSKALSSEAYFYYR